MKKFIFLILLVILSAAVYAAPRDDSYPWTGKWNKSTGGPLVGINTQITVLADVAGGICLCVSNSPLISASDGGWAEVTSQLNFTWNGEGPGTFCGVAFLAGDDCSGQISTGETVYANTTNASVVSCNEGNATTTAGTSQTAFGVKVVFCPDVTPPNVTLILPANDTFNVTGTLVDFSFNASEENTITNCSLIFNGTVNTTITSVTSNALSNISVVMNPGHFLWDISCSDDSGNSNASNQARLLKIPFINSLPFFTVNTTDGSNVSSPTNIETNVTFTATAEDPDNQQYRLVICSTDVINQSASCGGNELCASAFTDSGVAASCQVNTSGAINANVSWWSFVCDAGNCSNSSNVTSPYTVNFPPNLTSLIPGQDFAEDTSHFLNISLFFADPEGLSLGFIVNSISNIQVVIDNTTGNVTFIPSANFTGIQNISFTAYDIFGLLNLSNTFYINVTPVNDPPTMAGCSNPFVAEDTFPSNQLVNLSSCTIDIDNTTGELTWTILGELNSSLIDCSIADAFYLNCSKPAVNLSGINNVTVQVSDGEFNFVINISVTVTPVNDVPFWSVLPNQTIVEDSGLNNLINLSAFANDIDNITSELSFSISTETIGQVDCGINGVNFTATPAANWTGNNTVLASCGVRISDGDLLSLEFTVYINVTPVNDRPFLDSVSLNISTGRNGTGILVSSVGAGDIDSTSYFLQCGESSGSYGLCNSSLGSGERSCGFVSPWADDIQHTVYCILNDTESVSTEFFTNFTADNTAPNSSTINNLEGDTTAKYWDTDNDAHTIVQLNLVENFMNCRWDETDDVYDDMNTSRDCTIVGTTASCEMNVTTQINETTRYVACEDQYGNDQNTTQNTDVLFGYDYTIPSVNDNNNGGINFLGYSINLTITDDPVGTKVSVLYCNATNVCSPVTYFNGTNGTSLEIFFNQRGTWYVRYNATDEAGNINTTKQTIVFINTLPSISEQIYFNTTPHTFLVNVSVVDVVGSSQAVNFSCQLYYRNIPGAYSNKTMSLIDGTATDGTYSANVSIFDGFDVFDSIDTFVNCSDGLEFNVSIVSNNSVPNVIPTAPTVVLTPLLPVINQDLLCNVTVNSTDADGDNITYLYSWKKGGVDQNINISYVLFGNTSKGDVWLCNVTPFDDYENGTSTFDSVTIVNSAPEFNTSNLILNLTWDEDTTNASLNLSQHFFDIDGDFIVYNFTPVQNITVLINEINGIVTFIPDANFSGIRSIFFNATDIALWSNYSNNITLNITNVNDRPFFDPLIGNLTAFENVSFNLDINATDIDPTGDTLTFFDNSTFFDINSSTGVIAFTPNSSLIGVHHINFTVCDGSACLSEIITMTIENFFNDITFNVVDRINGLSLDNVNVIGGASCSGGGCLFNGSLTIIEENGVFNFNFSKSGFSTNISFINVTEDLTFNVTLDDTQNPSIVLLNITPRLNGSNTSFFIDIILKVNDNLLTQNATFDYVISNGLSQSGTPFFDRFNNTLFNLTLGPFTANKFLLNGTVFLNDTYGNNVSQTTDNFWFLFVLGGNVTLSSSSSKSVTIEFFKGWNLFSIPSSVTNTSLLSILDALGNGKYGCGRDNTSPFDCNVSDGDFVGNWTSIWSYNKTNESWLVFDPEDYYITIPEGQGFTDLDFVRGYWINMTEAQNLTINYQG